MKKLILGAFALTLTISVSAQNSKVISAYNYMQAYTTPDNSTSASKTGDVKNLDQAVKNIEIAINDPSTANSSKAWWYRSNIYQLIAGVPDTSFTSKYPKASLEVVKSFQKLKEINDPKFKDWSDAYENMRAICSTLFNNGITAFQKKDYHSAYIYFGAIPDMQDMLAAKGQKTNAKLISSSLGNAGLAADNDNDYADAIVVYKKLIAVETDSLGYISLISDLKKTKDIESAKKYTDEALTKFPSAKDILIDKINFYMADGKYSDAISYLQKASAQDPKNDQLLAALAIAYDQLKDTANARKVYEHLLEINPNSFEGNYGLGGMIFNRSKPIQDSMNQLGISKEDIRKSNDLKARRDSIFAEAKPYLEKALAARPDDSEVKKALNTIDAMTRK